MAKTSEKYELMYIINPNLSEEETAAVVEKFSDQQGLLRWPPAHMASGSGHSLPSLPSSHIGCLLAVRTGSWVPSPGFCGSCNLPGLPGGGEL